MAEAKKYLFIPLSSPGYVYPAIRLAHILEAQGHDVYFAHAVEYSLTLWNEGLNGLGIRNDGIAFLHSASWFNAHNAQPECTVLAGIVEQYQPDVIVSNPLVLAAFVLAERYRIPLHIIGFSEYLYPCTGINDPNKLWRLGSITDYYNQYRAILGLPFVALDAQTTPLIGDRYFIRNVPKLYGDDPLPSRVDFIGDLYWEPPYRNIRLKAFCEAQTALGKPLIYVQMGRLFEYAQVWNHLLQSFAMLDAAFVIDMGRADYGQGGIATPQNCFLSAFLPLGACAQDISLVMCSGQSTTCISALLHGKQILSLPHSSDSVEFTQRLQRNGVAVGLTGQQQLSFEMLQGAIRHLLAQPLMPKVLESKAHLLEYDDAQVYRKFTGVHA